jgi:excisionase family DNA binding protein
VLNGGKGSLFSARAVAARLGVSTATVYKLCVRGDLAHVRVSNAIRIEPAELEAFKARNQLRGPRSLD